MYLRLRMMSNWNDFLIFVGEIRKALAMDDDEKDRAFNRPPTITESEFYEFEVLSQPDDDGSDDRYNELLKKWIDWHDGPFYDCDNGWRVPVGSNEELSFHKNSGMLTLTWDHDEEYAFRIIPLLFRLALIVPFTETVSYSYPIVSRSMVLQKDRQDASVVERVEFKTDASLEAHGDFITFVLFLATLYKEVDKEELHIPREHVLRRV